MPAIVFLVHKMTSGYGVSVVVHELARKLAAMGRRVIVVCFDGDLRDRAYEVVHTTPERAVADIRDLIRREQPEAVIAKTSPFFEHLPELATLAPCWAFEWGDPTPVFFGDDREERQRIKDHKRLHSYAPLRGVMVGSHFLRQDIGFARAAIVYPGCDHPPRFAAKAAATSRPAPLKLGALMRLGAGEARYKGNADFVALCRDLRERRVPVQAFVMGRGTPEDAAAFADAGIEVRLNAPEAEKFDYLRELDVFVSLSRWEGFNLPLAEAQSVGTFALALDVGAHPEVTPFLVSSLGEAGDLIQHLAADRALLARSAETCARFVRQRFSWQASAATLLATINAPAG